MVKTSWILSKLIISFFINIDNNPPLNTLNNVYLLNNIFDEILSSALLV